jgi:hypothetical protein
MGVEKEMIMFWGVQWATVITWTSDVGVV